MQSSPFFSCASGSLHSSPLIIAALSNHLNNRGTLGYNPSPLPSPSSYKCPCL
ncbi:hypothetical protein Fmac_012231 [Flemingia macrophylla]|uniref:Uncharacterized protein n=1 Tax=Flemingia macrophylla TaxID=520843 RepID=A0ABD1MPP4_9FABA